MGKTNKMHRHGLLYECPECFRLKMMLPPERPMCFGPTIKPHAVPQYMSLIAFVDARVAQENFDYSMLANDINEAIEKTMVTDHGLCFSDRAIARALPTFLAALLAAEDELEGNDK